MDWCFGYLVRYFNKNFYLKSLLTKINIREKKNVVDNYCNTARSLGAGNGIILYDGRSCTYIIIDRCCSSDRPANPRQKGCLINSGLDQKK